MSQNVKSPINYTGNKYRLLDQFKNFFPDHANTFVDLFCGGATVGFNVNADKVVLIDNNQKVIDLLKFLAQEDIGSIIQAIEDNIKKYNLSYSYQKTYQFYKNSGYVVGNNGLKNYNKPGFLALRHDYNALPNKNSFTGNSMLYTLIIYGFNNDVRFNQNGLFNIPVGKTDFNKNNYTKLIAFNNRAKEINYEFICSDFKNQDIQKIILNSDFVYCDPPYLITDAFYNEQNGWTEQDEKALLKLLKTVHDNNTRFALSNVLKKEGRENSLLAQWIAENNFTKNPINYHYRSASYNKKNRNSHEEEVLITNEVAKC